MTLRVDSVTRGGHVRAVGGGGRRGRHAARLRVPRRHVRPRSESTCRESRQSCLRSIVCSPLPGPPECWSAISGWGSPTISVMPAIPPRRHGSSTFRCESAIVSPPPMARPAGSSCAARGTPRSSTSWHQPTPTWSRQAPLQRFPRHSVGGGAPIVWRRHADRGRRHDERVRRIDRARCDGPRFPLHRGGRRRGGADRCRTRPVQPRGVVAGDGAAVRLDHQQREIVDALATHR